MDVHNLVNESNQTELKFCILEQQKRKRGFKIKTHLEAWRTSSNKVFRILITISVSKETVGLVGEQAIIYVVRRLVLSSIILFVLLKK